MDIKIRASNFDLNREQSDFISRRLMYALSPHRDDIEQVSAWLVEFGPRDGDSMKRCLVEVKLTGGSFVISDNAESDLNVAVHRSVDRAGWKVARSVGRKSLRQSVQPAALPQRSYDPARLYAEAS